MSHIDYVRCSGRLMWYPPTVVVGHGFVNSGGHDYADGAVPIARNVVFRV